MATWITTARELAVYFGLALAVSAALTPVMERVALRLGAVDQPTARKRHSRPTPLLGGLAVYLAFWASVLGLVRPLHPALVELALVTLMVTIVGLWDDVSRLSVSARLVTQALATVMVLTTIGGRDLTSSVWLDVPLTFLWIVGVTNALNLLDNLDGVASAVSATAAASYAALFLLSGGEAAAGLAVALAGAAIGFLLFNYPPARLFMGDAGSFFLGMTLAVVGIGAQRRLDHPAGWIPAVLVLALPLFDTTLVSVSRLRRGKNPLTTPGRDHLAHRLARLGWSDRRIVAVFTAVTAALGVLAFFAALRPVVAWIAGPVVLAVGALVLVWLERSGDAGVAPTPHWPS